MKAIHTLALLALALPIHAADRIHAHDLMDADYAARCSAIYLTATLGRPDDSPEVGQNIFRSMFFKLHRNVTDEAMRSYMPWSIDLRKNDSASFINWTNLCNDLEMAVLEVYQTYFKVE